jgi:hypothetical protein
MPISPVAGGARLEQLVDHLGRRDLRDLGERRDLEEILQALLRGFLLVALPRQDAEQVPTLGF